MTYDLATDTISNIQTGDIINCTYSGTSKSIKLPKGKYKLECWGAQGGYRSNSNYGGNGGYSVGTLDINESLDAYVYAGGSGNTGGTAGGFNGGGERASFNGGGGASDIRLKENSLYSRVIVAGGGGSDGATNKHGMYGGGTSGGSSNENYGTGGEGGTQTSGGAGSSANTGTKGLFGIGGKGFNANNGYAGAGGGGWYGGAGSYPDGSGDDDRGGGGGSGYVYTSSTAQNYPSGCLLNSDYYLTSANTIDGNTNFVDYDGTTQTGHTGNGACRITVIELYKSKIYLGSKQINDILIGSKKIKKIYLGNKEIY